MKYAMSDLHGCYEEFMEMLELINFSSQDELYIVGDVVDRGPEPIKLLLYIIAAPNIHMLLGNHEAMMRTSMFPPRCDREKKEECLGSWEFVDNRSRWFLNGGHITDRKYNRLSGLEKWQVFKYLNKLPLALTTIAGDNNYIFIHGAPTNDFEPEWQQGIVSEEVLWTRPSQESLSTIPFPGKRIVFGHTPTFFYGRDSKMVVHEGMLLIDCGCVFGYSLGCVCLDNDQEYYIKSKQKRDS